MRKIIYVGFFFIFLVITPLVWAQTASPSTVAGQASPAAVLNSPPAKHLISLMTRLKAVVLRADKISQRINTRITKLNSSTGLSNGSNKMIKLAAQQKDLSINLEQLKINLEELNIISQTISSNSDSRKEYPVFKNKVLVFTRNLKDIYKQESDLVVEMKKITNAPVIPSIKVVPTQ